MADARRASPLIAAPRLCAIVGCSPVRLFGQLDLSGRLAEAAEIGDQMVGICLEMVIGQQGCEAGRIQ